MGLVLCKATGIVTEPNRRHVRLYCNQLLVHHPPYRGGIQAIIEKVEKINDL